ncbi:MAG: hypothetical protein FH749_11205 [Firmicutes bacterium]|nr:hypothetical protein [Bacillota bacterium]
MNIKKIFPLFVLLALALSACFTTNNIQSSPTLLIEAFMEAMEESNRELLAELTNRNPNQLDLEGLETLDAYEIHSVTNVTSTEAHASVTITFSENNITYDLPFVFHLYQVENLWYIQGADIDTEWDNWSSE